MFDLQLPVYREQPLPQNFVDLFPKGKRRQTHKSQKSPLTYLVKYEDFLGFWLGLVLANIDVLVDLLPVIIRVEARKWQLTSTAQAM
ncbi:MAG: hypothetical protein RR557_08595 [Bacilli bacterium]